MNSIEIIDLHLKPYAEVLRLQEELFNKNLAAKQNEERTQNYLILCEHEPVYTLGKSGRRENVLMNDGELKAEFYNVNRGGDVTFHGPGQLVVYPVFDLDTFPIGVSQYIFNLEETIIESLKNYGLQGERIDGAAGVWLKNKIQGEYGERKIAAIGAKVSRHVTMHGLAVNINTDLSYFSKIIACGLQDKGVTSLQKEIGKEISMDDYKEKFLEAFKRIFQNTKYEVGNAK